MAGQPGWTGWTLHSRTCAVQAGTRAGGGGEHRAGRAGGCTRRRTAGGREPWQAGRQDGIPARIAGRLGCPASAPSFSPQPHLVGACWCTCARPLHPSLAPISPTSRLTAAAASRADAKTRLLLTAARYSLQPATHCPAHLYQPRKATRAASRAPAAVTNMCARARVCETQLPVGARIQLSSLASLASSPLSPLSPPLLSPPPLFSSSLASSPLSPPSVQPGALLRRPARGLTSGPRCVPPCYTHGQPPMHTGCV